MHGIKIKSSLLHITGAPDYINRISVEEETAHKCN
jgi:hypothetical protein